jgi:phenylacetate-CoA ligase
VKGAVRVIDTRSAWRETIGRYVTHLNEPGSDRYWEPELETASRQRLREIQSDKLAVAVRYLYEESGFYRRLFDDRGLKPSDIQSIEDLPKIPVISRKDLAEDQSRTPPWGEIAPITDELWGRDGWLFFSTSGTTGDPLAFRVTRRDREIFTWLFCRSLYAGGIRSGNVALNCFSYGPFSAFWGVHLALNRMGIAVIPGGGLDTKRRAMFVGRFRPTILVGTPSYMLYLGETLREQGRDPAQMGVRFLVTAGEPGPCIPSTKKRMEQMWGGARIIDFYGCTEVAPAPLAYTCEYESSQGNRPVNVHLTEDLYIAEVVDPETLEPAGPGQRGVMVCTNLWSESQCFLRYRIGDYLTLTHESCRCGRSHTRVIGGFVGRPDDMVKVRGVVLFPSTIESLVRQMPVLTNEFMLVLSRGESGLDEMTVQVEAEGGVSTEQHATIGEALEESIRTNVGIRAAVDVLPAGTLPRTEFKARRISDLRAGAD